MTSESTKKLWADGPFKLIETPEYREKANGKVDPYVRTASIMAVFHNMILRGLNSIYLQAPHVEPGDYKDFISYCDCWYQLLDSHHRSEEKDYFPKLEAMVGEKGIMDINVEQHSIFEPGVEAFHSYLTSLSGSESSFSGARLCSIIDGFAPALTEHLSDEIPTLLALRKYGPDLPILELSSTEGRKGSENLAKTGPVMFFLMNLDRTFEDGRWADFPPIPRPVRWALTRVFGRWNQAWWKFASCDYDGKPQPLYAAHGKSKI